jgi:hypothetical protein
MLRRCLQEGSEAKYVKFTLHPDKYTEDVRVYFDTLFKLFMDLGADADGYHGPESQTTRGAQAQQEEMEREREERERRDAEVRKARLKAMERERKECERREAEIRKAHEEEMERYRQARERRYADIRKAVEAEFWAEQVRTKATYYREVMFPRILREVNDIAASVDDVPSARRAFTALNALISEHSDILQTMWSNWQMHVQNELKCIPNEALADIVYSSEVPSDHLTFIKMLRHINRVKQRMRPLPPKFKMISRTAPAEPGQAEFIGKLKIRFRFPAILTQFSVWGQACKLCLKMRFPQNQHF